MKEEREKKSDRCFCHQQDQMHQHLAALQIAKVYSQQAHLKPQFATPGVLLPIEITQPQELMISKYRSKHKEIFKFYLTCHTIQNSFILYSSMCDDSVCFDKATMKRIWTTTQIKDPLICQKLRILICFTDLCLFETQSNHPCWLGAGPG